jgi:TolB-like protein/Tfp pilus assembly protein PilF
MPIGRRAKPMQSGEIRFGRYRLDLDQPALFRDEAPVRLGGRALAVLTALAEAGERTVDKGDLLVRVWPGAPVEENNLQVQISTLRKALDDRDGSHIVTVPGRGYRLVGLHGSADVDDTPMAAAGTRPGAPSIAVLPFVNLGNDPEQDYYADGIVEDIITGLARIKSLKVIARNSSFAYKGKSVDAKLAGKDLDVRYLLEGSVRKAADRVRITAQLVDAATGVQLWAERYDRALDDIFAVQDELTLRVIGAIEPNLRKAEIERVRRKRPDRLDAYDLVLRALPSVYSMMDEGAADAIPLLLQAIAIDPDYARAHALLAWCYHFRFSRGGMENENRVAAVEHARAAISGGNDDAAALAISGLVIWFDGEDTETAMDLFDRALAISPSDVFALSCSAVALAWMGKTNLAVARAERALRLSPFDSLSYMSYDALAVAHFHAKRFEKAREAAQRASESNPHFSVPPMLLSAALERLGRRDEAKAAAHRALALNPRFTIRSYRVTVGRTAGVFDPLAEAWRQAGIADG